MNFLNQIIPLLHSYMPIFTNYLWLAFGMAFVAAVPQIIRRLTNFV